MNTDVNAGWDRGTVVAGIEEIEQSHPVSARHLRALLADRDRLLAALAEANNDTRRARDQRDAREAELAERTRERDHSDAALEAAARDMAQVTTDRDRLERELADVREELARMAGDVTDLRATVAMRDGQLRDVRAELEYVRTDREGLDLQRNRLLAERATARRDAAAGVLEWAARTYGDPAGSLAAMAHLIRDGLREVPGSPEPAPAGGEEPDHG
jgi:chromosome segregation ATPase